MIKFKKFCILKVHPDKIRAAFKSKAAVFFTFSIIGSKCNNYNEKVIYAEDCKFISL